MHTYRPAGIIAGFYCQPPNLGMPELVHIGEFIFPDDWFVSPHTHPCWEYHLQVNGRTTWQTCRGRVTLEPGGFLAVPPHHEHAFAERVTSFSHLLFVAFDLRATLGRHGQLGGGWHDAEHVVVGRGEGLLQPFRSLVEEARLWRDHRSLALRMKLDLLVVEAMRIFSDRRPESVVSLHPAVEEVRTLLELRPDKPWRLNELANRVGFTPRHLCQLFRKQLGSSPHQYLLHRRVARAKEILRVENQTITEVAYRTGFSSSQHFARVFRRIEGCSASAWLTKARE